MLAAELDRDGGDALRLLSRAAALPLDPAQPAAARPLLAGLAAANPGSRLLLLSPARTVLAAVPADPALEGTALLELDLDQPVANASTWSGVTGVDRFGVSFFGMRCLRDPAGLTVGYVAVEVDLSPWVARASRALRHKPGLIAALLPLRPHGQPILLGAAVQPKSWARVAALRANASAAPTQQLDGEEHQVTAVPLAWLHARLVTAEPTATLYAAPRRMLATFIAALVALAAGLGGAVLLLARRLRRELLALGGSARAVAEGRYEVRVVATGADEVGELGRAFNHMGDELQRAHQRSRVLHRLVMELFACNGIDSVMRKVVELACTQCLGEVCWFMPHRLGREVTFAGEVVYVGLRPWIWKNHRSAELGPAAVAAAWPRVPGDKLMSFTLKGLSGEIGLLHVAYPKEPGDDAMGLLHALITLVDLALTRQDQGSRTALVSTELEMAEAIQRGIISDHVLDTGAARVAYHYQPAGRLGGDWFYLIEDRRGGSLYVVIGDVTGHGLAQGLVTTAVKGALDTIERQVTQARAPGAGDPVGGPAGIVQLLQAVVGRVATRSQLTMTCLAAQLDYRAGEIRICNAGHTFPILVRREGDATLTTHLHRAQQPLMGQSGGGEVVFAEAVYPLRPDDMVIIYTDGLTGARNLKSQIFGRFLFRSLRQRGPYVGVEALKDEILAMFRYYTQGGQLDDDVCFVVAQLAPPPAEGYSSAAG